MPDDVIRTAVIGGVPLFREGLRRTLEDTRYHVTVIAPSIAEALEYRGRLDLLLLLTFASDNQRFFDAFAELRAKWPDAYVVAIGEDHANQLTAALKAGVHGYLARYISAEALLRFLSLIMLGQRVFSIRSLDLSKHPDAGSIHEHVVHGPHAGRIDSSALTEREHRLLALLVEGQSNKEIARRLGIAEATVKAQMARLFVKIGAANRTQAAVLAWASRRAAAADSPKASSASQAVRAG